MEIINYELIREDIVDNYATWFEIPIEEAEKRVSKYMVYDIIEEMYERQTEVMHERFSQSEG